MEWHLKKITENKHLNCFLSVYREEALLRADLIDRKIKSKTQGKLAGLVVGIKDNLCFKDHPLQAASNILQGFEAQYTATAVQRLLDEDAIIIGRQNCDEFGMGSSNENSAFGPSLNPIDTTRSPGGSSGASAAAVAADLCQVSLGSDTGGSVRQPAAFCGVFGLKPTYSRISRHGLIAYASSFDCVGIIGASVYDCALVLEVISGSDEYDNSVSSFEVPEYSRLLEKKSEKKFKVAVLENFPEYGIQSEIKEELKRKKELLKDFGWETSTFHFPYSEYVLPAYYILTTAEASSNLSRYDGLRFGSRANMIANSTLTDFYKKSRTLGFGPEVKRRILLGNFVLSSSYHNSYFVQAQKMRRLIRDCYRNLFSNHDLLLMPITPTTAFKIGEYTLDPVSLYLADLFSVQANLAGVPAISIPSGKDQQGLPIGLQLIADNFQEEKLIAAGNLISLCK